ncbi:30S ribosomal protein S6 [Alkalibacter rhizosphaerae]|uniref:Small ribosomal subunit protein bS6 n=1 Tax=Alkalibacter rhizosphaerae TaxID=2815577 RepID=A0A975AGN6_9FIRM|nr:30S ribosomal protein S6 [Alkalibacter rhizosphaerae]QSX07567.1 30S ribosomal protein S6 [Alkalibacter rhizosphaerae]
MNSYETIIIFNPELTTEQVGESLEKIKTMISAKGELENVEEWGKRKLAYKIKNKFTEGYYVLVNYKGTNELLADLDHGFKISEDFVRHLTIKKEV